jgi:large conductance mechanosensitive channel
MSGFIDFIRKQGVVGLAIGFLLGGAVSKMVTALVTDIINPLIGVALGSVELADRKFMIGEAEFLWGHFISVLVDFLVVAAVVYYGFKLLRLDKLDKLKV